MPSKSQLVAAMDEWLSTEGLHPAEINFIETLRGQAEQGEFVFMGMAKFLFNAMPETILSAVAKARAQGKCKEWPSA